MIVRPYTNPWPDPDWISPEEQRDNLKWAIALSDEKKLDALSGLDTPEKVNDFIKNVMLKGTAK